VQHQHPNLRLQGPLQPQVLLRGMCCLHTRHKKTLCRLHCMPFFLIYFFVFQANCPANTGIEVVCGQLTDCDVSDYPTSSGCTPSSPSPSSATHTSSPSHSPSTSPPIPTTTLSTPAGSPSPQDTGTTSQSPSPFSAAATHTIPALVGVFFAAFVMVGFA